MSRHANISVFVPHLGCPNQCTFCNQHHIAGTVKVPSASDVDSAVEIASKTPGFSPKDTEIAFFGGSFTAINRDYMIELLEAAKKYIMNGTVSGIRISTRPDAINQEILDTLENYGVTAIELGAQSMDDTVLKMNRRGHTAADVENASRSIKERNFSLSLQMMTGLPYDTDEKAIKTAERIISLNPDTVRIYPTIVLENTELATLYKSGKYRPQEIDEAVQLVGILLKMFRESGIKVIRTGLHSIDMQSYVAGPWHPAFRELCDSAMLLCEAEKLLGAPGKYIIYTAPGCVSKMIGQKRHNIEVLKKKGYDCSVIEDKKLSENELKIKRCEI